MRVSFLRIFCDLAEIKSFTKTAQVHGVSQSGVSQIVKAMEQELQATIIERSNKRRNVFRITPEGGAFLRFAKDTLNTLDLAKSRIDIANDRAMSNIRVAAVPSIGLYDLERGLVSFKGHYPLVNVHTTFRSPDEIYTGIHDGVDLGLVDFPVRQAWD